MYGPGPQRPSSNKPPVLPNWYFGLRNRASGQEIVYFADLNGRSYRKTQRKAGEAKSPTFSSGFCGGREPFQTPKINEFRLVNSSA